ncbi:PP2C family protein-serine/threonine phosphatase [Actinopolymorpha pittospori]|uniref:Protein phosphatase n=1 Tax=Actinopolymorpha pittospori TaxID=648752 RepID=A0A927NC80_9ACTN|nr:protein phosphatase 2C domain-containing protein [Actinopolymorpha pittospori]MBE1612160.1 protein phosphatase [Actinopolymorpha pittospori]
MRFACWAESHVGHVRGNNEDSAFSAPHLVLVADGVGGQAAGEIASASVAFVMGAISLTPRGSLRADPTDLVGVLRESLDFAYRHLVAGVAAEPKREGMATTLTAIMTDGHRFALAHVGDSRAYLLREGRLAQLTRDQTLVQDLVDQGHISPAQAKVHPYRSVVTGYVCATERPEPDLTYLDLRAGDRLLLCSDGLTDFVSEEEIASLLADPSREGAVHGLVGAALEAGGRDNVTCVVGDVDQGELMPWSRRPYCCRLQGAVTDLGNLIDPAAHTPTHAA